MNSQEFNEIVKQTERLVEKTLIKKQDEYNLDEDRLSFFKHNAQFLGKSPEEALWAMASKHFISLTDMINSKQAFAEEIFDEKIVDAINYLILLKGLVLDTGKAIKKKEDLK